MTKCDFCSSPDVKWRFRCPDFSQHLLAVKPATGETATYTGNMVGDWAACPVCHALIEQDDRERLLRRSIRTYLSAHPGGPLAERELNHAVGALHAQFFDARVGDPIPVERTT